MVRCKGMQCDEMHIPYVDTYLKKTSSITGITSERHFESPDDPMNLEENCIPQEYNGVCNVFNCPWVEFNTEETNSIEVRFVC